MIQLFKKHSLLEHAASLAAYLPGSRLYFAKYKEESELKKLINGLAGELTRCESNISELFYQHDINRTIALIKEWESALGIPDGIFTGQGPIEERRNHVIIKLTMSVQTVPDFEELARLLGYDDVEIFPLVENEYLPYSVPFIPWKGPEARFIAVVRGTGLLPENPPYDVPFDLKGDSTIITELFDILKPANTLFIYEERAK